MSRRISKRESEVVHTERAQRWYDVRIKRLVQEKHCSVEKAFKIVEKRRARSREILKKMETEPELTEEELEELHDEWDREAEGSPDAEDLFWHGDR